MSDEEFVQVEGIAFKILWDKFLPHSSIFIPSQNVKETKRVMKRVCKKRKFEIRLRVETLEDIRGVRVWRIEDKKG